ncbi:MAG: rhomboid family intramembrane serine protease [Cyanobacteria bacterium J06641_5]
MTLNVLLLGAVALFCTSLLLRVAHSRRQQGWRIVCGGILLLCGLGYWLIPAIAGFICATIWVVFVLVPLLGLRQVHIAVANDRFGRAHRWARGLAWLHPFDDWPEQPHLLAALARGQRGDLTPTIQLLSRYRQQQANTLAKTATLLLYRVEARWLELQHWIELHLQESKRWKNPALATDYLRALGETGNLNALVTGAARCLPQMAQDNAPERHLVRLYALAFGGQLEAVNCLLKDGAFAQRPAIFRQFWQATARWAAGNSQDARQQLERLQMAPPNFAWERAIAWRLQHPPQPLAPPLDSQVQQLIARIESDRAREQKYAGALGLSGVYRRPVTLALMGLNGVAFAIEIAAAGGDLQPSADTLIGLGALVPNAVAAGQWWRLVSANFLHVDALHLGANLLTLWFLGPYVEDRLGARRFLPFYAINGIGALGIYVHLALQRGEGNIILVGASAAIMSLLGGTAVLLAYGWYRERSALVANRLRQAIAIVGLQILFDTFIPATSLLGHLLGLLMGAITMSIWLFWTGKKRQS